MPAGIQIFDSKGNINFDTTDGVVRYLGSKELSTSSGEVSVDNLNDGDLIPVIRKSFDKFSNTDDISFSVNKNLFTWSYNHRVDTSVVYFFGVYK